jgi:hypothetical protein
MLVTKATPYLSLLLGDTQIFWSDYALVYLLLLWRHHFHCPCLKIHAQTFMTDFHISDSANFWWSYHLQINASPSLYVPYPVTTEKLAPTIWPMLVLAVILTGGYPQSLPMPSHSWWFRFFFGLSELRIPSKFDRESPLSSNKVTTVTTLNYLN